MSYWFNEAWATSCVNASANIQIIRTQIVKPVKETEESKKDNPVSVQNICSTQYSMTVFHLRNVIAIMR